MRARIVAARDVYAGAELSAAATTAATKLFLTDIEDFNWDAGGQIQIGDEIVGYVVGQTDSSLILTVREDRTLAAKPSLYLPLTNAPLGLADQSGNARHGTGAGGITIGGAVGPSGTDGATDFDGTDDYVLAAYDTRRNEFPNPSAEVDVLNIQLIATPTITRSTTEKMYGLASFKVDYVAAGGNQGFQNAPVTGLPASTQFTASAWIKAPVGQTITVRLSDVTHSSLDTQHVGTGAWTRVSVTHTTNAASTQMRMLIFALTPASSGTFYADEILMERGPSMGAYFDGSSYVNSAGVLVPSSGHTGWLGTVHGSASDKGVFANGTVRTFTGWANRDTNGTFDGLMGSTAVSPISPRIYLGSGSQDVVWGQYNTAPAPSTWTNAWPGNVQWVHWAVVVNEPADTTSLYINGVLISTLTSKTDQYKAATGNLTWGMIDGVSHHFDGKMAHTAVFERELSATEISLLAATPLAAAYAIGDRVDVYPPTFDRMVTASLDEQEEDVTARVPHTMLDRVSEKVRAQDKGEIAIIENRGAGLEVVDIVGEAPVVDGTYIDDTYEWFEKLRTHLLSAYHLYIGGEYDPATDTYSGQRIEFSELEGIRMYGPLEELLAKLDGGDVYVKGEVEFGHGSNLSSSDAIELVEQPTTYETPTVVQSKAVAGFVNSFTPIFDVPTTKGNVVLVAVFTGEGGNVPTTPTNWTQVRTHSAGSYYRMTLFRRDQVSSIQVLPEFAWTGGGSGASSAQAFEVSGIQAVAEETDNANGAIGTVDNGEVISSGSITTSAQPAHFVLELFGSKIGGFPYIPDPFSDPTDDFELIRQLRLPGSNTAVMASYFKSAIAAATHEGEVTFNSDNPTGGSYISLIAAFKAKAGGDVGEAEANRLRIYAKDVSGRAKPFVIDETSKVDALTPDLGAVWPVTAAQAPTAQGVTAQAQYSVTMAIPQRTIVTGIRYYGGAAAGNVRSAIYDAAGARVANRQTDFPTVAGMNEVAFTDGSGNPDPKELKAGLYSFSLKWGSTGAGANPHSAITLNPSSRLASDGVNATATTRVLATVPSAVAMPIMSSY